MTKCAGRPDRRRMSYSLRVMLVIVGLFALAFAFWEMLWPLYLMAAGPFFGAVIERARGGDGVTGGTLGGLVSYSGFVTLPYIRLCYLGYVGADSLGAIQEQVPSFP
jgi:polyferredoxin